jgi:hypothetical protein
LNNAYYVKYFHSGTLCNRRKNGRAFLAGAPYKCAVGISSHVLPVVTESNELIDESSQQWQERTMATAANSGSLERRLRFIERQLGLEAAQEPSDGSIQPGSRKKKTTTTNEDVVTRLGRLEARWHENVVTTPKLQGAHEAWVESLQRVEELDPGTALTHQQQIAAPLLYRRQEVLANAGDLAGDLDRLSTIVSLLLIGQGGGGGGLERGGVTPAKNKQTGGGGAGGGNRENITASQVTNAPILVEPSVSDDELSRLAKLSESLNAAQERVDRVANTLDRILHQYHSTISEISEKTVLLDAELARRGV